MPEQHGYQVELQLGAHRRVVTVPGECHQRAVKRANLEWPEHRVVRVSRSWTPIGECAACGVPVFEGDYHRYRGESLRCADC